MKSLNQLQLVFRGLAFPKRSHLSALLGAAIGSAVLVGALAVGDSVRFSLREMAVTRLGKTELALASNDRFFREALAAALQSVLSQARTLEQNPSTRDSAVMVAPVLQLAGTAAAADGSARANRVQVLGVDARFWELANAPSDSATTNTQHAARNTSDGIAINRALADHLRLKQGDMLLIRTEKPSQLSRDAPLSPEEDSSVAIRLPIRTIVNDEQFGRFSLQANQIAPLNAFVSLPELQQRLELTNRANLLLIGNRGASSTSPGSSLTVSQASAALKKVWSIDDAELELLTLTNHTGLELRSRRVFLDEAASEAALAAHTSATGILTYLVNQIRSTNGSTPYSMVTAMRHPVVPPEMGENEILINQWLADDQQLKPGDALTLTYFVVRAMRKPEEQSTQFRVRGIVPLSGAGADRSLMPDFPGLTDAENCRDWDVGFDIQTDNVREKDERYWDEYRGTPKAFVTLAAGQRMWSNRFGNLTAVRFPAGSSVDTITEAIRSRLDPASVGLGFQPVRDEALRSSAPAQDFGQLFLGFSFFLIVAALLLTSMMFQLGVEQRAHEVGTLLAVGFKPRQVRRLLLGEAIGIALIGGIIGVIGGIIYARAMLYGLSTIWREAVGTSGLQYQASPSTLIAGAVAGIVVAVLTLWLALRRQAQQPAHELLAEGTEETQWRLMTQPWKRRRGVMIGAGALAGALALAGFALARSESAAAGLFFGAGALVLTAGLAFAAAFLTSLASTGPFTKSGEAPRLEPKLSHIGIRNAGRRRKRSLATIGLLACGTFIIAAIGVFRLDANSEAAKRSSGTGGFAFIGEASLPIVNDLNSEKGREHYGIDSRTIQGVEFVPFRVRDGEDASCLNLNRAQRPRLLGVQPELLHQRGAFMFARVANGLPTESPWRLLKPGTNDQIVPAIGDAASIQWALGKKVGDTLDYVDEAGRPFKVRLVAAVANSILQGNLVIDESEFMRRFQSEEGYRMFLVDAPSKGRSEISAALSRALQDVGFELVPAAQRLAAFNAVQNTYLNTFQVLGALGLLLGSAGLAVVVLRNVLERRSELAVLIAVGFRPNTLKQLVLAEHGALLLLGLALGALAAFIAVLPALLVPERPVPYASLALTLGAVLLTGLICTWLATQVALRGQLVDALRNS